ncbi:DUF1579 family protein [Microscilla marina]|uniref:DUF1579 domain-containing protein n=1 Tax=Microscilla marina ATCC 23134 TaxID=313606 RepID=A1ZWF8_MICM2|nr:DUF1579 family protein [Microscilla marina]EAY25298.1 hypothetical protein M23134_02768 [Microscilla marina ATCC 23134]
MIHSFITLLVTVVSLQTATIPPTQKEVPLDKRFDFWVGKWNATWKNADGTVGKATNEITRILNGKVIKENFIISNDPKMKGFHGLSFSVYNPNNKTWKQTWVDNQGAYLDFVGKFDGNKRIFERSFTGTKGKYKGKIIKQRMVFYNIKADSFDWDWEASLDKGKTWKLNWRIKYTKIK